MTIYFNLIEGYLDGWSSTPEGCEHSIEVEKDHEVLNNPQIFKFIKGTLIKDKQRQQQLIDKQQKEQNQPMLEELNALAILELTETLLSYQRGEK